MQGNAAIIEALNDVLTAELTAINQYFIHHKMCENWGFKRLSSKKREESIEEMKHAEEVIDRILFLGGVPEIARYHEIKVGTTPREHIESSYELEKKGVATYNEAVALAIDKKDAGSRGLMERMVVESEKSIDWIESQFDLIELVGLEQYLAQQMSLAQQMKAGE